MYGDDLLLVKYGNNILKFWILNLPILLIIQF